jgi:hypothetical protein
MVLLRRHLRLLTVAWLAVQLASFSALVPRDCCSTHRPAASVKERGCHENAAATRCPMRAADGTPCPMHQDSRHAGEGSSDTCSMRGTCKGPMAALLAQLSNVGILTVSLSVLPDLYAAGILSTASEDPVGHFTPPDTPPPRA